MFTSFARACLLLVLGVCTASLGSGQPPEQPKVPTMQHPRPIALGGEQPPEQPKEPTIQFPRPEYTAFPDLKPTAAEKVKLPNGEFTVIKKSPLPRMPELGANPTPLRRVKYEQFLAGFEYVMRAHERELRHGPTPDVHATRVLTAATCRIGAELEEALANRVPWFEARVRIFKEIESFVDVRIKTGTERPERLSFARFERLQAEAELLELQAEIEKAKKK